MGAGASLHGATRTRVVLAAALIVSPMVVDFAIRHRAVAVADGAELIAHSQDWDHNGFSRNTRPPPLRVNGTTYEHGLGVHARSSSTLRLTRGWSTLAGWCALGSVWTARRFRWNPAIED